MRFKKADTLLKAILRYNGIGIKEQDIFSFGPFQPLVARFGKAPVIRIDNEMDSGKCRFQIARAVISRAIVNHKNFGLYTGRSFQNRIKALLKKVFDIIIDYNN